MLRFLSGLLALLLVWAVDAFALDINGELKKARLEQLSSDPTGTEGRVFWDTDDNLYRVYDGSSWLTVIDGPIVNADVDTNAAIAGTKISPNFGSQNIVTTGTLGVGTTATTTLTVGGAAAPQLRVTSSTANSSSAFMEVSGTTEVNIGGLSSTSDAPVHFYQDSSIRLGLVGAGSSGGVILGATSGSSFPGFFKTTVSTTTKCSAGCATEPTGFDTDSGRCIGAWRGDTGAPLTTSTTADPAGCDDATNVSKSCLCMGVSL